MSITIYNILTTLLGLFLIQPAVARPFPFPIPAMPALADRLRGIISAAQSRTVPPASNLPAPIANTTLKYVALGLGTQNYTCATNDSSSIPVQLGARANLYDTTLAMVALASSPMGQSNAMAAATCGADKNDSVGQMQQIGMHYFDAQGTPTFDLSPEGLLLKSKKMDSDPAPDGSCYGRDGGAAVPWLMLQDDGTGRSVGLDQVFRVETAGGSAPATCDGAVDPATGIVTRDYAALYYLYG